MSEKSDKALASINQSQEVTFVVPLKYAVILMSLAENSSVAVPYLEYNDSIKKQIALQLSGN